MTTLNREFVWTLMALVGAVLLSITGCTARDQSAQTIATYEVDGRKIRYESTKEQQGLMFDLQEENGKIKSVKIRADKSTTNDDSVTSSTLLNLKLLEMVQGLLSEAKAAAAKGR